MSQSLSNPQKSVFAILSASQSHRPLAVRSVNSGAVEKRGDAVELLAPRDVGAAVDVGAGDGHAGPVQPGEKLVLGHVHREARA